MGRVFRSIFKMFLLYILINIPVQSFFIILSIQSGYSSAVSRELETNIRQLLIMKDFFDLDLLSEEIPPRKAELFLESFFPQVQALRIYDEKGNLKKEIGTLTGKAENRLRRAVDIPMIPMIQENGDTLYFEMLPVSRSIRKGVRIYLARIIEGLLLSIPLLLILTWFIVKRITKNTVRVAGSLSGLADGSETEDFPDADILEYRMIAEASARLREKLLKKEEMLNQRLQDLTHDLKSPLTGLYCQIETLELIAPEPKDEMFHHIYNELGYLNHMVEDMSELSKLEKNRNPVNRQILRTEELAESLTGRFTPIAESGGIMISTDVSPLELSGDPVLLERAVGNLMHNAILHGSGPAVSLRIKPEEEGSGVTVEVENDGQIPEEDLPRIFNRYWRLNRNGQGSGLGLNIASVVIRKHGGELKVKNCSGNRVLFSFTIPQPN